MSTTSSTAASGGQCGGRVELVIGLARAALVQGDDHEVVLEGLAVHPHGTQLASARPAGEEEEHRVVDAAAAHHEGQVAPVDLHACQLRDAAGDAASVAVDDGVGGGGAGHDDDDRQQGSAVRPAARASNGDTRRVQRPGTPLFCGPPAPCLGRSESRAEDHREEREEAVDPAAHDEGHDPVGRVEVDRVDGRAGDIEAAELEGEHERGRSDQAWPSGSATRGRRPCRRADPDRWRPGPGTRSTVLGVSTRMPAPRREPPRQPRQPTRSVGPA